MLNVCSLSKIEISSLDFMPYSEIINGEWGSTMATYVIEIWEITGWNHRLTVHSWNLFPIILPFLKGHTPICQVVERTLLFQINIEKV